MRSEGYMKVNAADGRRHLHSRLQERRVSIVIPWLDGHVQNSARAPSSRGKIKSPTVTLSNTEHRQCIRRSSPQQAVCFFHTRLQQRRSSTTRAPGHSVSNGSLPHHLFHNHDILSGHHGRHRLSGHYCVNYVFLSRCLSSAYWRGGLTCRADLSILTSAQQQNRSAQSGTGGASVSLTLTTGNCESQFCYLWCNVHSSGGWPSPMAAGGASHCFNPLPPQPLGCAYSGCGMRAAAVCLLLWWACCYGMRANMACKRLYSTALAPLPSGFYADSRH